MLRKSQFFVARPVQMVLGNPLCNLSLIDEALHIRVQLVTADSMNLFLCDEAHYRKRPTRSVVVELTDPNRRYRVEEPTIQERLKPGYEHPRKKYTDTQNRMWKTETLKKKSNAQQKRKKASDVRLSKRLSKKQKIN